MSRQVAQIQQCFLVVYDFEGKIPSRFYSVANAIGERIQKSTVLVYSRQDAMQLANIVRKFGGNVRVFKVLEEVV